MTLSRRGLMLSGAAGLLTSGCAAGLAAYAGGSPQDVAAKTGVCHSTYAVLRGGVPVQPVVLHGCGPSDPRGADAVMQAASLTKPVVAFTALLLAREGRIDLGLPVSTYLPDGYVHRQKPFARNEDGRTDRVSAATLARIPLSSLLNHTSGLPNWSGGALVPVSEPGQSWRYSGEGYLLLQAVIAAATGDSLETAVASHVFAPSGMRDSRLYLTDDIRDRVVEGTGRMGGARHFRFTGANAAASLYTTAGDYAKFMASLASSGLMPMIVQAPVPVDPDLGLSWGLGWGIEQASGGPYLWQWGNNPGYRAFAMLSVTTGDGFVLMTNSEKGLQLAPALAQTAVPSDHGVFRFHMLG